MPADREIKAGPVPQDVLKFWRSKRLRPAFHHLDVWREEHDAALTVAKVMRTDVLAVIQRALDIAIAQGQDFATFKREIQPHLENAGWWDEHEVEDPDTGEEVTVNPPRRLKLIFDTNLRTSRAIGQWDRIQDGKALRPYLLYQVGPSRRHREQHLAWHGVLLPVDDPFWTYAFPPNGFNCFLPGTRVTGDFVGASKAWYAGDVVEVECESGATLTVTANHPIATANGWLAARELHAGMHCLSDAREVKLVRALGSPDERARAVRDQHVPARVEDVFEAIAAHGRRATEVAPLDFHGEAQRFVGQVEVVGSYVELVDHRHAAFAQLAGQAAFARAHARLPFVQGARHAASLVERADAAFGSAERGARDGASLRGGRALVPFVQRSGATAQLDAVRLQKLAERGAMHAAFCGELQRRGAGAISFDQITRVRVRPFRGHVFDLQSKSGWLLADGMAASNCRCHVRSVDKREHAKLVKVGVIAGEPEPILDDDGNPTGHVRQTKVPVQTKAPDVPLVPWQNKRTGEVKFIRQGIDPGFDRKPGEGRAAVKREAKRKVKTGARKAKAPRKQSRTVE